MDTYLRLFDANGNQLAANDDANGGLYSQLNYTFGATGTYYLGVSGYGNSSYNPVTGSGTAGGSTGDYNLSLNVSAVDPGDTLATAYTTPLSGALGGYSTTTALGDGPNGAKDVDLYAFQANAGTNVTAVTSLPTGGVAMDTYLRLFDANGNQLAANNNANGGLYSQLSYTVSSTGFYYLGVSGARNSAYDPTKAASGRNGSTGDYSLQLSLAPTLTIDNVSHNEGNAGTTAYTFTVTLSSPIAITSVTVHYATADGSASTADGDYSAASGTLTFAPNQTTQTVTVNVNGNSSYENDETFFVQLSDPAIAVIQTGMGKGTIVNDDAAPTLSIRDVSATEGNSGTKTFSFVVSLSGPTELTTTVQYATSDGTATAAGGDYVAASGTLTFAPGVTTHKVKVTVNGDTSVEPDESFFVTLSSPVNATLSRTQATGTILNDDTSISINNTSVTEPASGTVTMVFAVTLSAATTFPVTVHYATADGTATVADGDYTAKSGTLTFSAGQTSKTITVQVKADSDDGLSSETLFMMLSMPTNAILANTKGTGTIHS
jgi:chitinase